MPTTHHNNYRMITNFSVQTWKLRAYFYLSFPYRYLPILFRRKMFKTYRSPKTVIYRCRTERYTSHLQLKMNQIGPEREFTQRSERCPSQNLLHQRQASVTCSYQQADGAQCPNCPVKRCVRCRFQSVVFAVGVVELGAYGDASDKQNCWRQRESRGCCLYT